MKALCIFPLLALLLASCSDERVLFEENKSVGEDYNWERREVQTFSIPVQENKHPYRLSLNFRYANGYYFDKVLLKMRETAPNGDVVTRDIDFPVRDEEGNYIGDKGLDIIDLTYVLDEKKQYPEFGTYTYEIWQDMPDVDPLEFVMEVGLRLSDPVK